MAAPAAVDFFFGLGSRYSYLASTQLGRLEAETGCRLRWRPLFSSDLFAARGADPFRGPPLSGQYDWGWRHLDAARWADYYGVPFREPADVRLHGRRLALAATAAARLGAVERFSRRLLEAIFVLGHAPLDDPALARIATEVGLEPTSFVAALDAPATAATLATTVSEALAAGVFGVPSFVIEGELFWGNDRLPLLRHALLRRGGGGQCPDQRKRGRTQSGTAP